MGTGNWKAGSGEWGSGRAHPAPASRFPLPASRIWLVFLAALVLLAGCGFHLRGQADLPFASAYVEAPETPLATQLRRSLRAAGRTLTERPEDAQVVIRLTDASRHKSILSLSGGGRVREYRLEYRVGMSVLAPDGRVLLPPSDTHLVRDYTYDESRALAKEQEEIALFQSMEQDALRAMLIRLRFVQLQGGVGSGR